MTGNIPEWLKTNEDYQPKKDKQSFIDKSTKSIMTALSRLKINKDNSKASESNISLRLLAVFVFILSVALSHNFSFVIFAIAFVLVRIAIMSGDNIKSLMKAIIPILLISVLILLPALFLGSPKTLLNILSKIFVSASLVLSLNLTTSSNDITRGLKSFHIPDIVIFIFDIAIKYIFILGEVCTKMLTALKIRSVGSNKDNKAFSGVLGMVFIKAKDYVDETSRAMECRGFDGTYVVSKQKFKLTGYDLLIISALAVTLTAFVYLEVVA